MGMFGEVFQTAFVVRDLDAALRNWTEVVGVGPFYILDIDQEAQVFGRPMLMRSRMALAWWNDVQVEVIMPLDDAPNPYNVFLGEGREGLHHLACLSRDFTASDAAIKAAGYDCVLFGEMPGTRIAYYGTEELIGGVLMEVVEASDFFTGMLARLKAACVGWDGGDPVRPIERLFA